jgi:hypothetical protein
VVGRRHAEHRSPPRAASPIRNRFSHGLRHETLEITDLGLMAEGKGRFAKAGLFAHLACWTVLATLAPAQAQEPGLGAASSGLRGLEHTGLPVAAPELNLGAAAGYGLTESFPPVDGVHHRAHGSVGAAVAPMSWLAFALRLDGRVEVHPDDGEGPHAAGFGDPRLFARAGHALDPAFALGIELGAWFPGTDAPSFEPSATSAEARALLAFTPVNSPWVALGAFGFRLDNSEKSAPDPARLRLGDRISLGLSSSHAVLAALGLARRLGRDAELFAELSADLLVGADAPELMQSPLRAVLGGRYFMSRALQFELSATVSASERPPVGPDDPLVPIEPRVLVLAGMRYGFPLHAAPPPPPPREPPPAAPPSPPAVTHADVSGSLVDERGAPLPEAKITLRAQDGEPREAITDAEGRYAFSEVPVGAAELNAEATGFEAQTWTIEVSPDRPPEDPRALAPKAETGVLRGLIRSFGSAEPLQAQIVVRSARGKSTAESESGADGRFEIELPPGTYRVTIGAPGYRTHTRKVTVEGNGVAILNVDMRERK